MTTYSVSNATQLQTALSSAVGGDKIVLASGNYGNVVINNRNYASAVTIEAASSTGTHFDGLNLQNSKNLTLANIDIGRGLGAAEPTYTALNLIKNATNIKLTGVNIHGSLDGNPLNDGLGLQLTNVTGLNISNSKFSELFRGVAVQQSANVTFQSNEFTMIRSDGAVVAAVDGVVFDKNSFTDFRPSATLGDHADAIQFWNTGQTRGSSNITITDNVVMPGYFSGVSGSGVQGFFISDPLTYGYKNVLIQNNLIYSNGAYHGINVNGGTGVQIIGNTVVSSPNDTMRLWIRTGDSSNVTIKDNVTDDILLQNSTSVYQSHNTNFAVTPGDRALLTDLLAPDSPSDLIVANTGFQTPLAPTKAPVSDAVGRSIGNMLAKAGGTAALKFAVVDSHDSGDTSATLDLSGLKSAMVSAQPLVESKVPAFADVSQPAAAVHVVGTLHHFYDHFVALP